MFNSFEIPTSSWCCSLVVYNGFRSRVLVLLHDPLDHLAQGRLISKKGFKGYNLDFKRFGSDFQICSIKHRIQAHVEPETGNPLDRVKA